MAALLLAGFLSPYHGMAAERDRPAPDEASSSPTTAAADDEADWAELEAIDRALKVNTGKLTFIDPPDKPIPLMENNIHLTAASLTSGWARMRQCHEDLDPVPATQIVYHPERVRDLRITASQNIKEVRIEGATIQLKDIRRPARICIAAQTRSVLPGDRPGTWVVRNGPYMRQFLDGFYPMHVRLNITWPANLLAYAGSDPPSQHGLSISPEPGAVHLEAWFEGRLYTRIYLRRIVDMPTAPALH